MSPKPATKAQATLTLDQAIAWLHSSADAKVLQGMSRYGIPSDNAVGVGVGTLKAYSKHAGKDHALAKELWASGIYEARLLAGFIAVPGELTVAQMDRWASEFDNWAVCDTVCFHLFDRTPLAWGRVRAWSSAAGEFKKRAAFALLWGLTVHDKQAGEEQFVACLPLIERAASDERGYVKKAVDMALRATGKRSPGLRRAALELAERLLTSEAPSAQWIGRSTRSELSKGKATAQTPAAPKAKPAKAPAARKKAKAKPTAKRAAPR